LLLSILIKACLAFSSVIVLSYIYKEYMFNFFLIFSCLILSNLTQTAPTGRAV
jgi:hypothetical protein